MENSNTTHLIFPQNVQAMFSEGLKKYSAFHQAGCRTLKKNLQERSERVIEFFIKVFRRENCQRI